MLYLYQIYGQDKADKCLRLLCEMANISLWYALDNITAL